MKYYLSKNDPYFNPTKTEVKQYGIAKVVIVRKEKV
jgi:hypothetical protein